MSNELLEVSSQLEIARGVGEDDHEYVVRPIIWGTQKINDLWERFSKYEIFTDDIPHTVEAFLAYVVAGPSLWFEIYDETLDSHTGIIYINNMIPSMTEGFITSAQFHAAVWDSDARSRRAIAREAIHRMVRLFGIHRLYAIVPAHHGGAIRNMEKLGFTIEGRQRKSIRFHEKWFDAILLSLLEDEVE